jgi:hypothetical protein
VRRLVRTRPCPCGSGRAARDCCGRFKRVRDVDVARAYLHRQARAARELLAPFSPGGLDGLRHELATLPSRYRLVADALRGPATPEVSRLAAAAARRAGDVDAFVTAMVAHIDTPLARAALAKAVVAERAQADLDEHLAAAALVDLDNPRSELLLAATLAAVRDRLTIAGAGPGGDSSLQYRVRERAALR